jgi:leader peptidase (prepilin peptidase)/N-methyltransferase
MFEGSMFTVLGLAFGSMLVAVTVTDLERRMIPNEILAVSAAVAVAIVAVADPASLSERGIAAAGAGGFLLAAALARPGGMGMGDVKLGAVMGIYLGRAVAAALLIAFLVGAVAGVGLLLREGAAARKRAIPFGPFLALGGVIALWAGDAIVDSYLDAFSPG